MTAASPPVIVGFGGTRLELRSSDSAALESLRSTYRHLLATSDDGGAPPIVIEIPTRSSSRDAVRWARYHLLEALISERKELLWLHGAVAGRDGRGVLLPGRRGRGKSTLATELCRLGFTFLTDDIVPLDPATLRVIPFPRVPEVRRNPGRQMPEQWLLEVSKSEVLLDDRIERSPLPIAAIVLPEARRRGRVTLETCSPSEAVMTIVEGCWNFSDHGANAVAALGRLVSGVPLARVAFSTGRAAARRLAWWLATGSGARP